MFYSVVLARHGYSCENRPLTFELCSKENFVFDTKFGFDHVLLRLQGPATVVHEPTSAPGRACQRTSMLFNFYTEGYGQRSHATIRSPGTHV